MIALVPSDICVDGQRFFENICSGSFRFSINCGNELALSKPLLMSFVKLLPDFI